MGRLGLQPAHSCEIGLVVSAQLLRLVRDVASLSGRAYVEALESLHQSKWSTVSVDKVVVPMLYHS